MVKKEWRILEEVEIVKKEKNITGTLSCGSGGCGGGSPCGGNCGSGGGSGCGSNRQIKSRAEE